MEKDFIEERTLFDLTLRVTSLISFNQHGISTDGRGIRAVRIFTKQTLTGLSLDKILPRKDFETSEQQDFWDTSSIASLARNIMEGFLSLYYFGLEKVSSQEAELRFFILQLHRNTEWYNLKKAENPNAPELKDFENGIPEEKERIRTHPFLNKLTNSQRNKALNGHEIYKTKADFENELTICKDLRKNYRMLSNLVHPLPLSVERIDNKRGRGIRNEYDLSYCLMSMMIARRYLAASTVGIADLFPNELGNKFKKPIDSLRPLQNKGFDINSP